MGQTAKSLSEISHLFLSSVKEKGAGRPARTPPGQPRRSIDLTPEEFEQVVATSRTQPTEEPQRVPPVVAVISSHLGQRQNECLSRYAASLAQSGKRIGVIFVDVSEFRISTFAAGEESVQAEESGIFDPRAMRDAINELNCDLDQWLLSTGNSRLAESRALFRAIPHWVLLSTCEQEGVVASYRNLKGLEELGHPRLGIVAVDAQDASDADAMFRKLASVTGQFLSWAAEPEPLLASADGIGECQVLCCRTSHDKAQLATGAHWQVIEELLEQARQAPIIEPPPAQPARKEEKMPTPQPLPRMTIPEAQLAEEGPVSVPAMQMASPASNEVVDLAEGEGSILHAVMKQAMGELVECPVRPPMCPDAVLAITRDRRIILLAEAGQGMCNLNAVAAAWHWLSENRPLLAMAMPQFALDTHQLPHLRLLVEHGQFNAATVSSLFQSATVQIRTYRKLRWGQRIGLLLEAA